MLTIHVPIHGRLHRTHFLCRTCIAQLFRSPMKFFDKLHVHEHKNSKANGTEYISNQALEEALIEELHNGPNISLTAISSCLSQRIDPNIPDRPNSSNRPLHYAAKYGNTKLMTLLLDAGASIDQVNALGQTPLMISCRFPSRRHLACAKLLMSRACNMELRDKGGSSALEQSITSTNVACVKYLLHHGARLATPGDRSNGAGTSCTLFEQPDESTVLALAEAIRARSVGMESVEEANAFFAELIVGGGPSLWDRMMHKRLCSDPHIIADCIKRHSSSLHAPLSEAQSTQTKPLRRPRREEKSAITFIEKVLLFVRKKQPRTKTYGKGVGNHCRKAQSKEIGDEMEGNRYPRKLDGRRLDGRKGERQDPRRRATRTARRTNSKRRSSS